MNSARVKAHQIKNLEKKILVLLEKEISTQESLIVLSHLFVACAKSLKTDPEILFTKLVRYYTMSAAPVESPPIFRF